MGRRLGGQQHHVGRQCEISLTNSAMSVSERRTGSVERLDAADCYFLYWKISLNLTLFRLTILRSPDPKWTSASDDTSR